ncbi:RNA pseudouridylate synthase [Gracilibacillus halophilus YIM-C55.5]|uniref:RNA pseudouridylate synthase n=1 Tax=Gracilibacillus halophilus YIM-C55.5 TaxID=1308866 RepID=N4WNX3_9BACI|nr:hypothetical protein [Gracilibacillus halophilus]ENH96190.1 RNA pseudouridylate synthase [Gracilibacillus halophilus YIM-C55.5]
MQWKVEEHHESRIVGHYLRHVIGVSRSLLHSIKHHGQLLLNGEHVTVRHDIHVGDIIRVELPEETPSPSLKPQSIPIDIVYEDDDVLVINKPPNMASMLQRNIESIRWPMRFSGIIKSITSLIRFI